MTKNQRRHHIYRAYQAGATCGELSARYGLHAAHVWHLVRLEAERRGEELRPPKKGRRQKIDGGSVCERGETFTEIACDLKASISSVANAVHREARRRGQDFVAKRRPAYGSRDAAIFDKFQAGASSYTLADKYRMSHQRILQIVDREASLRGVTHRPIKYCTKDYSAELARYQVGESFASIAARLGLNEQSVRYALRRQAGREGVVLRPTPRPGLLARRLFDHDDVYRRFQSGEPVTAIAADLKVTAPAVIHAVRREASRRGEQLRPTYRGRIPIVEQKRQRRKT